jgi:hypothetical protein
MPIAVLSPAKTLDEGPSSETHTPGSEHVFADRTAKLLAV